MTTVRAQRPVEDSSQRSVQRGPRRSVEAAARKSDNDAQLVIELNGIRVAAACQSASAMGGDFYVLDPQGDGKTTVLIGDVCGRGAVAAHWFDVLLPAVRATLAGRKARTPAELLTKLDRAAARLLPDDVFATALCATIDPIWREVLIASAGHVPVLLKRAHGHVDVVGRASGPPLGLLPGALYREERVRLGSGDLLVLMTDGVLEAVETDLETLSHVKAWLAGAPRHADEICEQLLKRVSEGGAVSDDRTVLSIELDGIGRAHTPMIAEGV